MGLRQCELDRIGSCGSLQSPPHTGEITQREFGVEAEPIAEWAKMFEYPKCVYKSGSTGWHLARALERLGVDPGGSVLDGHNVGQKRLLKTERKEVEMQNLTYMSAPSGDLTSLTTAP